MKRVLEGNEAPVDPKVLWDAVRKGDLEMIKKLVPSQFPFDVVELNEDGDEKDSDDDIVLIASKLSHLHILEWYIKNYQDYSPKWYNIGLADAIQDGRKEVAKIIIENVNDRAIWGPMSYDILAHAAAYADLEFFKYIYSKWEYSFDSIKKTFSAAVEWNKAEILEFLLSDRVKRLNFRPDEVFEACASAVCKDGKSLLVLIFEKCGAAFFSVNMSNYIKYAAINNNIDTLSYLMKVCPYSEKTLASQDALLHASFWGCYEAVNLLLQDGVKCRSNSTLPNENFLRIMTSIVVSTGLPHSSIDAITFAAFNKYWKIVELLLDSDAYQYEVTPVAFALRYAIVCGNVQMAKLLLASAMIGHLPYVPIPGLGMQPTYEFHRLALNASHFHMCYLLDAFPRELYNQIEGGEEREKQCQQYHQYFIDNKIIDAGVTLIQRVPGVCDYTEYKMMKLNECKMKHAASFLEMYLCMPEIPTELIVMLQNWIYDVSVGVKGISTLELPTVKDVTDVEAKLQASPEAIYFAAMCKKNTLAI